VTFRPPPPVVVADGAICRAEFDPPDWRCPECDDAGGRYHLDGEYEVFAPCPCRKARRRLEMFNQAQIGKRFAGATLGSFKPRTKTQQMAQRRAEEFALSYPKVDRGLLFWGPVGTGKTHLAVSIFRELTLRKGVGCRFVDYGNLLADLKRSFSSGSGDAALMMPLVDVELLVIDELGKGRGTEWEETVLDDLVSRRYNAGKVTLCTTNFDPHDTAAASHGGGYHPGYDSRKTGAAGSKMPSLVERIGERIYSRLCSMCEFVQVDGADHRRGDAPTKPRARR